jgi:outer membrane protein insertion porin family
LKEGEGMLPHKTFFTFLAIIFIIIFSLMEVPGGVQAQNSKQTVETVQILGNRRLRDEDIISHIKTRPGDSFSEKRVQQDLQSLLEWGVFDKAQARVTIERGLRGGVVVVFELTELPLILEVTYKGLRGIEEAEIIKVLREKQIKLAKGEVYDPVKVHIALHIIRELLSSRGWSSVTVSVREELSATHTLIEFSVRDKQQSF